MNTTPLPDVRLGRRYRQKDGMTSGPVMANTGPNRDAYPFAIAGGYSDYRYYTASGHVQLFESEDYDLVAEVVDEAPECRGDLFHHPV